MFSLTQSHISWRPQLAGAAEFGRLKPRREALCWKQNFTRGVGTVGTACGSGQEKQDGLCYPNALPATRLSGRCAGGMPLADGQT